MESDTELNTIKEELNLNNLFIEIENHKPILYVCLNDGTIKTFKLPKKDIDKCWIENKLNVVNNYKNLEKVFKNLKLDYNIYYTSFGFSYNMILGLFSQKHKDKFNNDIEEIKNKLNSLNIGFRCEFSDGGWVYRFIISKSKENIKIIGDLK